jgi:hypothetical protein
VITLDTPGPAVTKAKARPLPFDSLKYSTAIAAETSCTNGIQSISMGFEQSLTLNPSKYSFDFDNLTEINNLL